MEIIPLIKLEDKKIIKENENFLDSLEDDALIYIYDTDGIEKDKPCLCIYQNLSKKYSIWVDSAPRDLGDIVDIFLTGAVSVTIRKKYCPQINIEKIREISENKVYNNIIGEESILSSNTDGLVLLEEKQTSFDFQIGDLLKKHSKQRDVFVYEKDMEKLAYWSNSNIKGLLIDINKLEEANKWILKKKL